MLLFIGYESPKIITAEEMQSGKVTYELVVQRRKELFEAVNGLRDQDTGSCKMCMSLIDKKYKDVNFEYLGGSRLPTSFDIQHFTSCNLKCTYCIYAVTNNFVKPQYDILKFIELYREKGKLLGNNWIDFNGGEPTLLENFDEIIDYLISNNVGTIVVYTNGVKYSEAIFNALKENKIILTTSIDAGTASTYKKLHGADVYIKVIQNLIKYKSSGIDNIEIKYIVTDDNMNDDDLYGFLFLILSVRPIRVMLSINFNHVSENMSIEYATFTVMEP